MLGGMDVKYFKWNDRYYVVQSYQFFGGPDTDLGAIILDVSDLPDPESVKDVARIRNPESANGFHNIFIYKHSNGRVYLLATTQDSFANVYDLGKAVDGDVADSVFGLVKYGHVTSLPFLAQFFPSELALPPRRKLDSGPSGIRYLSPLAGHAQLTLDQAASVLNVLLDDLAAAHIFVPYQNPLPVEVAKISDKSVRADPAIQQAPKPGDAKDPYGV